MKRILITGAFGYVGMAALRRLVQSGDGAITAVGHTPRAAERAALDGVDWFRDVERGVERGVEQGVEQILGDVSLAAARLAAGDVDSVIHLAGGGGEAQVREDPVGAVRSIVHGTALVAEAARQAGVRRRLYASTVAVYGTLRDHGRPYAEDDQPLPDDLYGTLKHAAEHVWTALGGGTALRIANVYGAGAGVDLGINGAVERFARAAARGDEITVYGEGLQKIDYVHVDDVVEAFRRALEPERTLPAAINIGGGRPIAVRDLAQACVRAAERRGKHPRLRFLPAPAGKIWPDRSLAIDRARAVLG